MEGWPLWIAGYIAALVVVRLINHREFELHPDKGQRYAALPIYYKAGCWFVVIPLWLAFVLVPIHNQGWLVFAAAAACFFGGLFAMLGLEILCVRWYRKHGHFETVER
jgi:hypothetical protein